MVGSTARRWRRLVAGGSGLGLLISGAVAFSPLSGVASAVVTSIPGNYFTVQDTAVDDEPTQKDLTQMGRDDTSNTRLPIFWSWDDTSFSGQTGDACALFSATADGYVTFAICAEVEDAVAPATGVVLSAGYPLGFTCTPNVHPLDRCDSSTPASIGTTTAGAIAGGSDLITQTDPTHAGQSDTTIAVDIQRSVLPAGANLVNVCSYPSAANGANNDPSDCIVTPGGGFLQIVKNTTGGNGTFNFTIDPGNVARSVTTVGGTGTSSSFQGVANNNYAVTETVPSNWLLTGASCLLQDGTTPTGTFNAGNAKVSGVTIQVGRLTTCTFADTAANPTLHLVKDTTTANYDAVGDVISYTYTLTNTGNVPLVGPYTVNDDKATVTCGSTPDPLLPGVGSVSCTASYTVTQADLDAGSVTNHATAHANYNGNDVASNPDSKTVNAVQSPQLTLDKNSGDTSYDAVGDVLHYTYDLTNTGNVTLDAPYSVEDKVENTTSLTVTCPAVPAHLAPGDPAVQCTATYTVTQDDLDRGSVTNLAKGHAKFSGNDVDSNTDTVTINATRNPSLHLHKAVTEATYDHVGQVIHYTYTLTNDGNVTLHSPYSVDDDVVDVAGSVDCSAGPADLAPGAHFDCTATYTVLQSDLDAGSITNHAKGHATFGGNTVDSNPDQATINATQSPALTLDKTAAEASFDTVGQVLHYTYKLTNSGNVTLSAPYAVTDDKATVTCPAVPATLAPGDHVDCTATYTVTQADINAGAVTNHATGSATFGGNPVSSNPDQATVPAIQRPALTLDKRAMDTSYAAVGDVIDYVYELTNTGNVTLTSPYAVSDDLIGSVSCALGPANLAPGAGFECSGSYTVTQADLDAGVVVNHATATATLAGNTVTSNPDQAQVSAAQGPALGLVKNVAEASYSAAGDTLNYTYTLTNIGNVTLSAPYGVNDDRVATVDCPSSPATLAPGASVVCAAEYAVTQDDVNAGSVTNHATAVAMFKGNPVASNQDEATVPAIQDPLLTLHKSANKKSVGYGETLTYTVSATNTGNVDLTGVVVSDAIPDGTTYVDGSAEPAAIASFDGSSVSWAVGDLAVGDTVDGLTFKVTVDTPDFDPADGLPAETIDNVAVGDADQVDDPVPSNHVKTPVVAVLGVHHVRKPPPELPFTGATVPVPMSLAIGFLLIAVGSMLTAARRRT